MATVLFVRDGNGANNATGFPYLLSDVIDYFGKYERLFSLNIPTFNKNTSISEYAGYKYVVVRIDADEVCQAFPKTGHYIIKDLTASNAAELLGLNLQQ